MSNTQSKDILQHIINSNIPQDTEQQTDPTNNNENLNGDKEFDCDDDLKLSDDEEETEQNADDKDDDDTKKEENEISLSPPPPTLKKKGSIVEMLMEGPDFNDDTELSPKTETEPNNNGNDSNQNDADPELPDLDVKKGTDSQFELPHCIYVVGFGLVYIESKSDDIDDDIPPPPPPPRQLSKIEEYESEIGIERVKLKYPYLASEIINCQIPQIMDAILNQNNPFLEMLFDFIEQAPPLNAVLTNYWRSCVVGLVRRNESVILTYIKQRKNLLSSLVQHIRDQSIMELVIALGWDPAIEELKGLDEVADWMYSQQLVPKLIATLSPKRSPDEHSAASYTLVDIVAKTSRSTKFSTYRVSMMQVDY